MTDAELKKLTKWKATERRPMDRLGDEVVHLFKRDIERRQVKFGKIGEAWLQLVPAAMQEASELSSLSRGTLTVIVQGSTHLYALKQAMLAGLQDQLLHACRSEGLRKINLKPGKISA
jgi:hypothetical protein